MAEDKLNLMSPPEKFNMEEDVRKQEEKKRQMDKAIHDAIVFTESSGRPDVVGDVGHPEGASYGLMQIQENTAKGLYKQGLLPEKWEGKKVKKKNLISLLKDPEFNKLAGSALFVDNKRRLRKMADKHGVEYTPEQLNEWAIKAHNQGVTKTLKRDVLGLEEKNPKVEEYLQKIKSRLPKPPVASIQPRYQEGGIADLGNIMDEERVVEPLAPIPFRNEEIPAAQLTDARQLIEERPTEIEPSDMREAVEPIEPPSLEAEGKKGYTKTEEKVAKDIAETPKEKDIIKQQLAAARKPSTVESIPKEAEDPIRSEYDRLVGEYKRAEKEKNKAKKLQAMLQLSKAMAEFGAQYGAGRAMVAGRAKVATPKITTKIPTIEQLYQGPDIETLDTRMALIKSLRAKTPTPKAFQQTKLVTEAGTPVIFDPNKGKFINTKTGNEIKKEEKVMRSYGQIYTDPRTKEKFIRNIDGSVQKVDAQTATDISKNKKIYNQFAQNERELIDKFTKEFASETKPVRESLSKVERISGKAIDAIDNPIAASQLGAEVATIFENGRLTDEDVKRYTRRLGITDRVEDALQSIYDGTINEEKAKLIQQTLRDYAKNTKLILSKKADEKSRAFQKRAVDDYKIENVSPLIYGDYRNVGEERYKSPEVLAPNEIKRRDKKTGKTAIFDRETKKFLRWEE